MICFLFFIMYEPLTNEWSSIENAYFFVSVVQTCYFCDSKYLLLIMFKTMLSFLVLKPCYFCWQNLLLSDKKKTVIVIKIWWCWVITKTIVAKVGLIAFSELFTFSWFGFTLPILFLCCKIGTAANYLDYFPHVLRTSRLFL